MKRLPQWLIVLIVMAAVIGVALWLRVTLPYSQVFVGEWVKLTGIDAYYYMRLVDNLVRHFPQLTEFDPYMQYPGGSVTGSSPDFFAYLIAGIVWLLGLGRADQHTVDVIAVYIPPALAVLTIIGVYFIGRVLGSIWIGLMAAGLLAIMPGEFLNRSLLGYTDHHIAEVLFSTVMMLFVFEYVRKGEGKSLAEMKAMGRGEVIKLAAYGVLGGISLGLYLLTWAGGLLFVLILFIYLVVQSVIDHLRGRSVDYLGVLGVSVYGAALLMYLPGVKSMMTVAALVIGIAVSVLLLLLSGFMAKRKVKALYYPVAIVVLGLIASVIAFAASPDTVQLMLSNLYSIFTWQSTTTVMEMQPILLQQGQFTLLAALGNYMLGFFLSLVCILILIYSVIKKHDSNKMLLLIWSIVMLMATLAMRRFAYYYAVNVSILTGLICWFPLNWGFTKLRGLKAALEQKPIQQKRKRKIEEKRKANVKGWVIINAILVVVIILVVYYPNIGSLPNGEKPAVDLASRPLFAPSDAWSEMLDWLKQTSPEPYENASKYYDLFDQPGIRGGFEYPSTAYGVLSWWDYGYWVTRAGRRVPASNPGTGHRGEAFYFMAQNEILAGRVINNWGSHYIIVDNEIAAFDSKFHALATLSGHEYKKYFELAMQKQGDKYAPVLVFYPDFYRSMLVRLYNFDGRAIIPDSTLVIGYQERKAEGGQTIKEILEQKKFASYTEAVKFINDNKSRNYLIVGDDPYKSPVPLEELKFYKLIFSTKQKISAGQRSISKIKVFEYKRDVLPVAGDWNKDKKTEVGLWQPEGSWFLLDKNGNGKWEQDGGDVKLGPFGYSTDVPLTGDWNGDGYDEIGVWRPSDLCFYLDYNGDGQWDPDLSDKKLGPFGWWFKNIPVAGDWNGDGKDEIGIWGLQMGSRSFYFFLDDNGDGNWNPDRGDRQIGPYGEEGDIPVSGDWNGEGKDKVGIWQPATRYFILDVTGKGNWMDGKSNLKIGPYGESEDSPVTGDWDGSGKDRVGMWDPRSYEYILDISGDGNWNSTTGNIRVPFSAK